MKQYLSLAVVAAAVAVPLSIYAAVNPTSVTRPAGTTPYTAQAGDDLVALGKKLWSDPSLSKNGKVSCNTCHIGNAAFKKTFEAAYPHKVAMAKAKGGLESISSEQMVQFCMVVPMKTKPLAWDSKELAALSAYTEAVQIKYAEAAAKKRAKAKK